MITRKITTIVEDYDTNGKLVKKTTTETTDEGNYYYPIYPYYSPTYPQVTYGNEKTEQVPWWVSHPWQITCDSTNPDNTYSGATTETK